MLEELYRIIDSHRPARYFFLVVNFSRAFTIVAGSVQTSQAINIWQEVHLNLDNPDNT